jgi:hypothetical protein
MRDPHDPRTIDWCPTPESLKADQALLNRHLQSRRGGPYRSKRDRQRAKDDESYCTTCGESFVGARPCPECSSVAIV